jgi:phosphinothricin acetyltransferase
MRTRLATNDDAEAIRVIYNAEVVGSTVTFDMVPRSPSDQLAWLVEHRGAHPAIVAVGENDGGEDAGESGDSGGVVGREVVRGEVAGGRVVGSGVVSGVLGFASVSPYRNRPAYSTTVEDSVYVRPDCRGQGVGRLLLSDLVELTAAHGFHSVMARIVGGHEASIALHRSCGFQLVGVEREVGRKFGRWLDVVVMQRLL